MHRPTFARATCVALLAGALTLGCAPLRNAAGGADCTAASGAPLRDLSAAHAVALAGNYAITLVANDGPRAGQAARGTLTLVPNDTLHRYYETRLGPPRRLRGERPLRGWATLEGDVGLETAGTPLDSRDPELPGVTSGLDSLRDGLTLRLGDRMMFDGGFNELTVTAVDDDGFAGRWRSSAGFTTYHAGGWFCARRVPAAALASGGATGAPSPASPVANAGGSFGETVRVLHLDPGITVTLVAPARIDPRERVDLILYALPNGNTTAQTIGRRLTDSLDWHFDIQHIGAQVRMLRTMGYPQAVVAYLEARGLSWPAWRRTLGYDSANARIVRAVDEVRAAVGDSPRLRVTLAGHSGGGSLMFGFIEGAPHLPARLDRIVLLDANYNFDPRHAAPITEWLAGDPQRELVVLAYDDRNIMLNGKKVVSDSGGTWRASERMLRALGATYTFATDTVGEFVRHRAPQVQLLMHPNPENRILHTEMIGEMNGFAHAMLVGRPGYDRLPSLLRRERAYTPWVDTVTVP